MDLCKTAVVSRRRRRDNMGKTKKLMQESILLAADAVSERIKYSKDKQEVTEYAEAMLKLALAW